MVKYRYWQLYTYFSTVNHIKYTIVLIILHTLPEFMIAWQCVIPVWIITLQVSNQKLPSFVRIRSWS